MIAPLPQYRIFGLRVASALPLPGLPTEPADGPADLRVSVAEAPLLREGESDLLYASAYRTDDGESRFRAYRHPEGDLLCFARAAEYLVGPDFVRCYPIAGADPGMVAGVFTGAVLSLFLERHGIIALHASVVSVDERAVAFLSNAGSGKSTLAASLARQGHALLSDDILALETSDDSFLARPGYPLMRLYPPEAHHFLGHAEDLPRVVAHLDKRRLTLTEDGPIPYCAQTRPLAHLFLPSRLPAGEGDGPPAWETLSPRDALMECIRHSFAARLAETLGLQRDRLPKLSRLVERYPVDRFTYASGFDRLPEVCQAVLQRAREQRS